MEIKEFLENSVYYPACAFDGTPIKFLGKMFSNFVYVDYLSKHNDLEKEIKTNGLLGYRLIDSCFISAEDLFGINWETFIQNNNDIIDNLLRFEYENPFAKLYSFKRKSFFNDKHGRENIELLYIKSEGILTYRYLYTQKNITPVCLVSIVPGLAFGGNFDKYPEMLINLIKSTGKLPKFQFYDDQCAIDFYELIKYYNVVNEYNCNRDYYHWSSHFTLAEVRT